MPRVLSTCTARQVLRQSMTPMNGLFTTFRPLDEPEEQHSFEPILSQMPMNYLLVSSKLCHPVNTESGLEAMAGTRPHDSVASMKESTEQCYLLNRSWVPIPQFRSIRVRSYARLGHPATTERTRQYQIRVLFLLSNPNRLSDKRTLSDLLHC